MNLYLDESGDLGWTFNKPYGAGGSSRYLTIATILVPKNISHLPKRIVKEIYRKRKQPTNIEIKGNTLSLDEKEFFLRKAIQLLKDQTSVKVSIITVKKENVQSHIRDDSNKLYNYMVNFAVLDLIKSYPIVNFIPDPRSIKVASGNSLIDYLQTKLWFELNARTTLINSPMESKYNLNIQFIDFLSNIIWSRYEFNKSKYFNLIKPYIIEKNLFF
jgi:hypothetical protein